MKAMKPLLINNLDFAISQQAVTGTVDLSALSRLNDLLAFSNEQLDVKNQPANIQYILEGSAKKHSQPSLQINIKAELPTICQRCLNEMRVHLNLNFDYLISDIELAELNGNDDVDWLETSREFNVWELIEDELLIAFPIAPVHSVKHQEVCIQHNKQSGEKPNPFAVLKDFATKSS